MNKNLLHFIEIAEKHTEKNESFLDQLIQSSQDDQHNDRYMILLLIKIWQNDNELLGYRFKEWYQKLRKPNPRNPLDLIKHGHVQECMKQFEQKIPKIAYEAIQRHNFFPKFANDEQRKSFDLIKDNVKFYDDPVLFKINKLFERNSINVIQDEAQNDWMAFVMLYTQFFNFDIAPSEMTKVLQKFNFQIEEDELQQTFWQIVILENRKEIVNQVMRYDLPLTYFLYCYFEAQGDDQMRSVQEIYDSKLYLASEVLKTIENDIKYKKEILYFFKEIVETLKFLKNQKSFEPILNEKMQGLVNSSNDFVEILILLNEVSLIYQIDNNQQILGYVLERLFSQDPLQNSDNAIIKLIQMYQGSLDQIKQKITENLSNQEFNPLFKDFLINCENRQQFEQELIQLSFRFGIRLGDLPLKIEVESPEQLIMGISKEFIENLMKSDVEDKLRMKIVLSNLLAQCQQEDAKLNVRKDVIRLLIRRL